MFFLKGLHEFWKTFWKFQKLYTVVITSASLPEVVESLLAKIPLPRRSSSDAGLMFSSDDLSRPMFAANIPLPLSVLYAKAESLEIGEVDCFSATGEISCFSEADEVTGEVGWLSESPDEQNTVFSWILERGPKSEKKFISCKNYSLWIQHWSKFS